MAPVRSIKCISRPPSRLPSVLVSLGKIISVISDCELATVRARVVVSVLLIRAGSVLNSLHAPLFRSRYNGIGRGIRCRSPVPVSAILAKTANSPFAAPGTEPMDKIAGLKEILALDPKNSFARYGIAMELAGRGETAAALTEFDTLLRNDPDYTAGYFMSAQTLVSAGRTAEAIERLKGGIGCAARSG